MVIEKALQEATSTLTEAGMESPRLDAEVLLAHLLQKERLYLLLHRKDVLDEKVHEAFMQLINRRSHHEPVAYLVGQREFMSLNFSLTPGVLIPRPDTETLVEYLLETFEKTKPLQILDLCTGSGAIAVSLAYYLPNSMVTALDVSPLCVETAQKNARQNGVAKRVQVLQADVLKPLPSMALFDAVVSNPPYIPTEVVHTLEPDVQNFEPHLALDGGDDGLIFYRHLVKTAPALLKPGGTLALETGHDQATIVAELMNLSEKFENIGIKKDLAGIGRVAYGQLKRETTAK